MARLLQRDTAGNCLVVVSHRVSLADHLRRSHTKTQVYILSGLALASASIKALDDLLA